MLAGAEFADGLTLKERIPQSHKVAPHDMNRGDPLRAMAKVPVVKVSSRTGLAERWPDLIDIDTGTIATGSATIEEVGWEIFRFILDVASGRKKTWAGR